MVQVFNLPESTQGRLGREMGLAFAQGIAKNLPSPEMQQVGRQQQSALANFKQSLAQGDAPVDISMKWAQAMAGVPGAEQLQKTVLPQYQLQAMGNLVGGGQPMMQGSPISEAQQTPMAQMGGAGVAAPQQYGQPADAGIGGMMAPGGAPSQMGGGGGAGQIPAGGLDRNALQTSMITGIPYQDLLRMQSGIPQQELGAESQNIELAKAQERANYAQQKMPKASPDDINDFVRIGTKYQNMNPEDWFKATQRDYMKFKNVKANFDNANIPGIISGLFRGGKYRADTLKQLEALAKPLIDLGYEDYVRSALVKGPDTWMDNISNASLSPAEAEMIIKPLDKAGLKSLDAVPKTPYSVDDAFQGVFKDFKKPTYDEVQQSNPKLVEQLTNKYADFLANNVNPKVSLLGLRERLRKDKGLDWRQFNDALTAAVGKGLTLSAEQQGELGELTNAPRDSLPWIFQDWGRWMDYLAGKK